MNRTGIRMQPSRLATALASETLPASGPVVVFGAPGGADPGELAVERLRIVQGFRPDHDAWAARGYKVQPATPVAEGPFAAAVIFLPRVRALARAWVAEAALLVGPGGAIWIDGQKTDGIEAMLRDLRALTEVGEPYSKAHGKVFRALAPAPDKLASWLPAEMHPAPGFITLPGVFSAETVDRGSALLAASLPAKLGALVADLGAGWGWLSAQVLTRDSVGEMHLIEADHAALASARANVTDPRARFHWADATAFRPERAFDTVVANPPFHAGRTADPGRGIRFIRAAAGMLRPGGALWLVANRHLPYEAALRENFRDLVEAGGDGAFKIFHASHPVVSRPAPAARPARKVRRNR